MRYHLLTIALAGSLAACNRSSEKQQHDRFGYDLSTEPLLLANELGAQTFTISNAKDTVLIGKRGTIVSIPADCFSGATGPVQIEIIEALDMSDLILLNAPTISDRRLLVTDGVVYVNAFSNGKALELNDGKTVEIEIPTASRDDNMQVFTGEFDEDGRMDWRFANEMVTAVADEIQAELTYQFLTIPMDLFPNRAQYFRMDSIARAYPWHNGELQTPDDDLLIGKARAAFYADAVNFLNDRASENTPLATREFGERLSKLENYFYYWFYPQQDGSTKLHYDVFGPFQQRIFQVYLTNMDKDLWYCDSLAVEVMEEWMPRNANDSTERSSYESSLEWFTYFRDQRLTKPVAIDDHGVDLNAPDALPQLLAKGVQKDEARRILELNGLRQNSIGALRAERAAVDSAIAQENARIARDRESAGVRYYLISANKLGWINVDRFYDEPNAKECEVTATVNAPKGADKVTVGLVFSNAKTYIDGIPSDNGMYHFTKDDEYYRRLPVGEEATMVAIAYTDGKPWLALKRITIAERMDEKLDLTAMSMDEFKTALKALN